MALSLQQINAGETTTYRGKINSNTTAIETLLNSMLTSYSAAANLTYLLTGLFRGSAVPVVLDEAGCVGAIVGTTVTLTAGWAYQPGTGAVLYNSSTRATASLAAYANGTYYIGLDTTGAPAVVAGTTDAIYSVVVTAGALGSLNKLATNSFGLTTALTAIHGGTGKTVYVVGDLLQADATTTLATLAAVATGNALISGGVGTVSSWGKIGLSTHVSGDLPFANLTQGDALSLLGVAGNATADHASIAAASDYQVMRRSGTAIAFGAIDLSQAAATTGDLPFSALAQGSALSVLGVATNGTADVASIAASTDHQVLRRSGTALGFGALALAQADATTGELLVSRGGTGLATLTAHAIYVGNGTSAPAAVAVGATGTVLAGATGADPAFTANPSVTSLTATSTGEAIKLVGTNTMLAFYLTGGADRSGFIQHTIYDLELMNEENGNFYFGTNAVRYVQMGPGHLSPSTHDAAALGHPNYAYSDGYLATGAVITWGGASAPNATLTHSAGALTSSVALGVGGTPGTSSALQVDSTTGAFLPPRMTTTQRDALTAVNGMIIYNSTTDALNYYKAGAWTAI